jgi:DNA-binding NarL/FixJ family response regulator
MARETEWPGAVVSARAVTTKGAKPLMAIQVEHARTRPVLSERQRQVARGLERGLSSEEIAAELGIAPRTVKAHCDSLRRTLDVPKRRLIVPAFRALEGRS